MVENTLWTWNFTSYIYRRIKMEDVFRPFWTSALMPVHTWTSLSVKTHRELVYVYLKVKEQVKGLCYLCLI